MGALSLNVKMDEPVPVLRHLDGPAGYVPTTSRGFVYMRASMKGLDILSHCAEAIRSRLSMVS